jgi:hypothetical protein
MEPVFMVLGQSSAVAACLAIDKKIAVQQVNVKEIQSILRRNPLADGSTAEVLVDNEAGHITGDWKTEKFGGYGPTYLTDTTRSATAKSVQFAPEILKAGAYQVYTYFPKVKNPSAKTYVTVYDGEKATEKVINQADLRVEGQTSGEWLSLGQYNLSKEKKPYVEISNKNADGTTVADAVLFVPVK